MPTPIRELTQASALCDRIGSALLSTDGIRQIIEPIAAYLGAETASYRALTVAGGRPSADAVVQLGLADEVEDAYRTRYFKLDPALRLLRQPFSAPVFPDPKRGGAWQHERAPLVTLGRQRNDFRRYRREFLLPNGLCHHVGFCVRDRLGRTLLFDFHRPDRMPVFGRLEVARARLIAAFVQVGVAYSDVKGALSFAGDVDGGLSHREVEIAHAVAQGLSNKEVATRFAISVRTVENHVRAIFAKLEVNTRTRLAAKLHGGAGASTIGESRRPGRDHASESAEPIGSRSRDLRIVGGR